MVKKVLSLYFILIVVGCFSFLMVESSSLHAAELISEPILAIATEMHRSEISSMDVDSVGRYLVTGSHDKTVKVWSLPEGRYLKTLRVPVGEKYEGAIFAVAISPDGSTIACGVRIKAGSKQNTIHFFDRESGRMIRTLSGFPRTVMRLRYSRDGKYLLAGSVSEVARIFSTVDYSLSKELSIMDGVQDADFSFDGKLVVSSYTGSEIRLYDKNFALVRAEKRNNNAGSVSFSPDGSRIAVGYYGKPTVEILSGENLSLLYTAQTTGTETGDFGSVAWSSDGGFLYGGGRFSVPNHFSIRKWNNQGRGNYTDIAAGGNRIMHMISFRNGNIAFCSSKPSLGFIDGTDKRYSYVTAPKADFMKLPHERFLISHEGKRIKFVFAPKDTEDMLFSADDRSLTRVSLKEGGLKAPIETAEGISVTGWQSKEGPKLNGKDLEINQKPLSFAISPDGKSLLVSSIQDLFLFDTSGKKKWVTAAALHRPYAVNISGNGKVAVAACEDGVIRWYRMSDGKELLSLFVEKDKNGWILWTPKGYYDASPGADNLIGWHVNNGFDREADFFSIGKFRKTYYRPDIIEKTFQTLDEDEAVGSANLDSGRAVTGTAIRDTLPPVVNIVSPVDGTKVSNTSIPLKFTIRSDGAPVTDIKVLVNGRPVAKTRDIVLEKQDTPNKQDSAKSAKGLTVKEMTVNIPEGNAEISVIASNRHAYSESATVGVKWQGKVRQEEFVIKPKLYILAIGVSRYQNAAWNLQFAAKDAKDFVEAMKKQQGVLYREVAARVMTDQAATKDSILDGLEWISRQTTQHDIAMIFMSAHGLNDKSGIYYFAPYNLSEQNIKKTGVLYTDIKNTIDSLPGKTLVFVDTCHSGNVMGSRGAKAIPDINGFVNELVSAESGAVVFASSTGRQQSQEDEKWANGAFTKALIEGISGKADVYGKGKITVNMLDLYLSERVKELTKGAQTPTTTKPQTIQDFPVAVKVR